MLLVILGHCPNIPFATEWLYTFHMPLFIVASGCVFRPHTIKKRFKSLIVPYFYFLAIALIISLGLDFFFAIVLNHNGPEQAWMKLSPQYLHRIIPDDKSFENSFLFKTIWFLPVLFAVQVAYQLLTKLRFYRYLILSLFCIGCYCSLESYDIPCFIDTFCTLMAYFYIGNVSYPTILKMRYSVGYKIIALLIILPVIIVMLCDIQVDYKYNVVPIYNHLLGIFTIMGLYFLFCKVNKHSFLERISKDSIIYFGFHRVIFAFLLPILIKLSFTGIALSITLWTLTTLLIYFVVAPVVNNKFPFIIGKAKQKVS